AGRSLIDTLAQALSSKALLLILDNCEHLLDGCARVADTLLRNCPNVRVLATGREPLGIAGERKLQVPSLGLPDVHRLPSARRLVERAVASQPAFSLTTTNAPAVAQVCHRLDGIPLALELAAARVRVLSVEQIGSRLDDRFRLLTGGSRTALPRQQTLRALIDWSYDLLSRPERRLFGRLAVFAGGWAPAAAVAGYGANAG